MSVGMALPISWSLCHQPWRSGCRECDTAPGAGSGSVAGSDKTWPRHKLLQAVTGMCRPRTSASASAVSPTAVKCTGRQYPGMGLKTDAFLSATDQVN